MKKFLSLLVGLLLSLTSIAQTITPIDWTGNHLNAFEQTVLLDSTWSGVASVKAYTSPGGRLISALLQPTMTRQGNALFIRFASTANMSNSTYVTISTGNTVRRAGYLSLGAVSAVKVPQGTDAGGVGTGIINTDMVQGLPLLLAKKVDTQTQSARDQGQDNQLAGVVTALTQTNNNVADRYTKTQSDQRYAPIGSGASTADQAAIKAAKDTASLAISKANSAVSALQNRLNYVTSSGLFSSATADVIQFDNASWEKKTGTVTPSTPGYGGMVFPGPTGFYYARRYSGAVDITWLGAVSGDGLSDYAAVQAAINFIPNSASVRGGSILIPAGFYSIDQKLTFPVNVRITLVGVRTSQYNEAGGSGSCLVWTGPSGGTMLEYDGGSSTRHNGPTIDGVNFYSNDLTSTLLRFRLVTHWTIKNSSFRNGGTAFELDAGIGVLTGGDNAWGLWSQNVVLDCANYGLKVTNGTYGFLMEGGDMQVAQTAVGVYLDEYSQHVRLVGTKHDRGNPAIYIKGGHNHLVGVSIENATVGIKIDRVATTYTGVTSVFSGKFNQIWASSIVGWMGTETGMMLGAGTAANSIQFEGVNLASRLVADGQVDSYSFFTNGIWRLQNRLSAVAVQEYNIGTTLAGQFFASGNGVIFGGTTGGKNLIMRPATGGGLQVQKPDGTIVTNFNEAGDATHRGTFRAQPASGAGGPTGTDLAPGFYTLWKNTTDGTVKWYYNDNGTIKAGAAFN